MPLYSEEELKKFINNRSKLKKNNFELSGHRLSSYREWAALFVSKKLRIADSEWPKEVKKSEFELAHQKYKYHWLTHMIRHDDGPTFSNNFTRLVRSWDVVSCSLTVLKPGEPSRLISSVGFLLSVPPQNIIGAHNVDVWVPNHIGSDYKTYPEGPSRANQSGLLAQSLLTNVNMLGPLNRQLDRRDRGPSMTRLLRPNQVLKLGKSDHNEVIVAGRRDVSIYPEKPPTGDIMVHGIIIAPSRRDAEKFKNKKEFYTYCWQKALSLRKYNQELGIKVVRHLAYGWDWRRVDSNRLFYDDFL